MSDNFIHGKTCRTKHQVSRSYECLFEIINNTGFEFVKSIPMFVIMNDPVDTNNRFLKKFYSLLTKSVRSSEIVGKIIGCMLSPIEKLLISFHIQYIFLLLP